jgi:hypothetical protein
MATFSVGMDRLNDTRRKNSKTPTTSPCAALNGNDNSAAENKYLYGGYDPIIVTITHILNEQASIGWTSYSHTGVPVPVFAEGREAFRFAGFYDNTDIAKKLARAMDIREDLPVENRNRTAIGWRTVSQNGAPALGAPFSIAIRQKEDECRGCGGNGFFHWRLRRSVSGWPFSIWASRRGQPAGCMPGA